MIQILGNLGGDNDTLNKELSATQSDGGNLFSTPFGDKTMFHIKNGRRIMLMFTFDPDKPYNSTFQMASITGDYMQAIRRGLTKLLIDADAKRPTIEETIWTHLKSTLSNSAFTEMLKQDTRKMHEYVTMLSKEASLDYKEEQKLTDAMSDQDYKFRFDIAIDSYPGKIKGGSSRSLPPSRKGVLSFFIQTFPKLDDETVPLDSTLDTATATPSSSSSSSDATQEAKADTDEKMAVVATPTEEAPQETKEEKNEETAVEQSKTKKRPRDAQESTEGTKSTKKRLREMSPERTITRNNEGQKQWKTVCKRLKLVEDEVWSLNYKKRYDTAYDFFEAADKWFLGCIKSRAERLQNDKRKANSSHLYH